MSIHSDLLINWTLKDAEKPTTQKYVDRLIDLYTNGLFVNEGSEKIIGQSGAELKTGLYRVCLTEIRITKVETHASRYGRLGIGFKRQFVIERGGNPVFYIPNGVSPIAENFIKLQRLIEAGSVKGGDQESPLLLLNSIAAYIKNMNEPNSIQMEFYEEMEWRIIHYDHLVTSKLQRKESDSVYRVPFTSKDVNLLVFPSSEVMQASLADPYLKSKFEEHAPMMIQLSECSNF